MDNDTVMLAQRALESLQRNDGANSWTEDKPVLDQLMNRHRDFNMDALGKNVLEAVDKLRNAQINIDRSNYVGFNYFYCKDELISALQKFLDNKGSR
jgi:hypothetical protein